MCLSHVAFASWAIFAQSALALDWQAQSIDIQGKAKPVCNFAPAQAAEVLNMTLVSPSSGQIDVGIDNLTDPQSAQLLPGSISITLKGACNHAHSISLSTTHGGLHSLYGAVDRKDGGFLDHVHYVARLTWALTTTEMHTADSFGQAPRPTAFGGAFSGFLQLQVFLDQPAANNTSIIAGAYSDSLFLTIKPQL